MVDRHLLQHLAAFFLLDQELAVQVELAADQMLEERPEQQHRLFINKALLMGQPAEHLGLHLAPLEMLARPQLPERHILVFMENLLPQEPLAVLCQ